MEMRIAMVGLMAVVLMAVLLGLATGLATRSVFSHWK